MTLAARDGQELVHRPGGQLWFVSWHPPDAEPEGTPHGAAGICVTADGAIVVVSQDGERWELPAGRPEGDESLEQTLRREVLEEACATVTQAQLLGFARGRCMSGPEAGRVIVRSIWRADVELALWEPQFEMLHRRLVAPADLLALLALDDCLERMIRRALREAGIG